MQVATLSMAPEGANQARKAGGSGNDDCGSNDDATTQLPEAV